MKVNNNFIEKRLWVMMLVTIAMMGSCDKEKDKKNFTPIKLQKGSIVAEMGDHLSKTVFVDLSTKTTTLVDATSWDLAFESNGKAILINTGKKARILNTTSTDFSSVTRTEDKHYPKKYTFEQTDGDLSRVAMGDWASGNGKSKKEVYILDMGTDVKGKALGHKKLVVLNHAVGSSFQIKYASMDGSDEQTKTIKLSPSHNFVYFSLGTGNTVSIEPKKGTWDIAFTRVSVRTGPPSRAIYRLAASAQTNSYENVGVAVDDPWKSLPPSDKPTHERNKKDINSGNYTKITKDNYLSPSTKANSIGRNWLQILQPHRAGKYKVYDFMTFILKDPEAKYFKLRFISFKNPNTGKNGSVQFQYEQLK